MAPILNQSEDQNVKMLVGQIAQEIAVIKPTRRPNAGRHAKYRSGTARQPRRTWAHLTAVTLRPNTAKTNAANNGNPGVRCAVGIPLGLSRKGSLNVCSKRPDLARLQARSSYSTASPPMTSARQVAARCPTRGAAASMASRRQAAGVCSLSGRFSIALHARPVRQGVPARKPLWHQPGLLLPGPGSGGLTERHDRPSSAWRACRAALGDR